MTEPKLTLQKILGHWRTIRIHRKWVKYYCRLAGIRWRGLVHDLSKYSPTEFFESARYWTGTSSPINEAKKDKGYSRAWLHHRGRNSHHWAYWADNFSEGLVVYPMPKNDFVEMVCDFLGAARAYCGKEFTYSKEYKWWLEDREKGNKGMHPANKKMLDYIFQMLEIAESPKIMDQNHTVIKSPEEMIKSGLIKYAYYKYQLLV